MIPSVPSPVPRGPAARHRHRSGQALRFHTATFIPHATDALATEDAGRGRTPILVIDEAYQLAR